MLSTRLKRVFVPTGRSDGRLKRCLQLWAAGQREEAITRLRQYAKKSPSHSSLFESEVANLFMREGEWESARSMWLAAVNSLRFSSDRAKNEKAGFWLLNSATCAYLVGDLKVASIDLITAERLNKSIRDRPEYILLCARLLQRITPEVAVDMLSQAATSFPADHALNFSAAELLLRLGHYVQAKKFANQAVKLQPHDDPSRRIAAESTEKANIAALHSHSM